MRPISALAGTAPKRSLLHHHTIGRSGAPQTTARRYRTPRGVSTGTDLMQPG